MDDREALLRTVLSDPADDMRREVYADYVEERGEVELAEFIRVQCRIAELGGECVWPNPHDKPCPGVFRDYRKETEVCEVCGLQRRERELWNDSRLNGAPHPWVPVPKGIRIRDNWLSSYNAPEITIRPQVNYKQESMKFRLARGFVSELTATLPAFLAHAGAVFACQPVTRVVLPDREPTQAVGGKWFWPFSTRHAFGFPQIVCGEYDTRETALEALSAAATSYGRQLAGLPPLPTSHPTPAPR